MKAGEFFQWLYYFLAAIGIIDLAGQMLTNGKFKLIKEFLTWSLG